MSNALKIRLSYAFDGINSGAVGFQNLGIAILSIRWRVTNPSGRPIEVDFFNYIDIDVVGPTGIGGSNDLARLDIFNPGAPIGGWIKQWDNVPPNPGFAPGNFEGFNYIASGAHLVGWEIGAWTGDRRGLTKATIINLPNAASPFGPGDAVAIYQWRFTLNPGESAEGWEIVAVNVPEPGSMIALGAGLASLLGLRRRRKR